MSLSRREIVLISILLLAGTLYAFYNYLYMPVRSRTEALKTENNQLQAQLSEAEQAKTSKKNPADDVKKLQNEYKVLLNKVPEDPYVPEMMVYIADSARDSKVKLNSLDYKYDEKSAPAASASENGTAKQGDADKANPSATYRSSQLDVEVVGDYNELLNFLLKIENAPRLYVLSSAKFDAGKRKAPEVVVNAPEQTAAAKTSTAVAAVNSSPGGTAAPALAGSAAYDGSSITLKLKFSSYYDQTTTGGMKGVDQEVAPTAEGKNPFI
ncbi:MAG TPA: hypothetical protein VN426_03685 [Syntrophomonadaceae bacterium]|nr:hypothetical protein [Syntrophomonadaceae bacterium]